LLPELLLPEPFEPDELLFVLDWLLWLCVPELLLDAPLESFVDEVEFVD